MRFCDVLPVLVLGCGSVAMGCGGGGAAGDDTGGDDTAEVDAGLEAPLEGFQIVTPNITVAPGDERTYCYYTTIDIDQAAGVKRWASEMTDGSHHLIVYFTETAEKPDGTIDEECGGIGGGGSIPVWTYSAQNAVHEMVMPEGVGMRVNAQQHLYVQMHYLNATPNDLDVHVTINGETYADGEDYTPAAAYVTYNTEIDLQPGETASFGGSCAVPADASFFTLSTHAHKRATRTQVMDGATMVFESDDWEHPGFADWGVDHHSFSGTLNYQCDYYNGTNMRIQQGQSAELNEMCMAVGYFFPADGPVFCLNSFVVPQ